MNFETFGSENESTYCRFESSDDFYFTYNGRKIQNENIPFCKEGIQIHPRLVGGKGGFGSMLRAIGARIEKTTNHEACRDLSGRRMRDVNNEKQISEWLQEKETKEKEKAKKHEERIERTLNPKMRYEDKDYTKSLQGNVDKINEALKVANEKGKDSETGSKRKSTNKGSSGKKPKLMLGLEGLSDEDDSENSDIDDDEIIKPLNDEDKPSLQIEPKGNNDHRLETQVQVIKQKNFEQSSEINSKKDKETKTQKEPEYLNLDEFNNAEELQSVGLERLKSALMFHGLKCGGTLQERADRLFLTKDKPLQQLDPSLFAKTSMNGKKAK